MIPEKQIKYRKYSSYDVDQAEELHLLSASVERGLSLGWVCIGGVSAYYNSETKKTIYLQAMGL